MAKLPDKGISIPLVRRTLGVTKKNVSDLCSSDKLNKWSYWKPVHVENKYEQLTKADIWKAHFGFRETAWLYMQKYGIDLTPENIWLYETAPGSGNQNYGKPYGTKAGIDEVSPYRLPDFAGYNHAAKPIVEVTSPIELIWTGSSSKAYRVRLRINYDESALTPYNYYPNTDTEVEGGISKWCLALIVASKEMLNVGETFAQAYAFGPFIQSAPFTSYDAENNEVELQIREELLDHLMGKWIIGVVMCPVSETERTVNSLGITSGYYSYPAVKIEGSPFLLVEGGKIEVNFPDGAYLSLSMNGGVWPNESWTDEDLENLWPEWDEWTPTVQVLQTKKELTGYPDEYATLTPVRSNIQKYARRVWRNLKLGGDTLTGEDYLGVNNIVLNEDARFKGLVHTLPVISMWNGEPYERYDYVVHIYQEQKYENGIPYKVLNVMYVDEGGAGETYYQQFPIETNTGDASFDNYRIRSYEFWNETNDLLNQVTGLMCRATRQYAGYDSEDTRVDSFAIGYEHKDNAGNVMTLSPYLPPYDVIHIGLPELSELRNYHAGGYGEGTSYYGGTLPISYEIKKGEERKS